MNIKNRISKLEEKSGVRDEFCDCKETRKCELYWQHLTSDFIEIDDPQLKSDPVDEFCSICNREIEKNILILQGVESNIPKPEGMR